MPGRDIQSTTPLYQFTTQGQQTDPELSQWGMVEFELRFLETRLGRWMSPDPYHSNWSPYVSMANNPISYIDSTGGKEAMNNSAPMVINIYNRPNPWDHPFWNDNFMTGQDWGDNNSSVAYIRGTADNAPEPKQDYRDELGNEVLLKENLMDVATTNSTCYDEDGEPQRLIIVSHGNLDKKHNTLFSNAGRVLKEEYNMDGSNNASLIPVLSGREIVQIINVQNNNSISSLDIISHGGWQGIWFSPLPNASFENCLDPIPTNKLRRNLYYDDELLKAEVDPLNNFSASIREINYNVFTDDARVEIHGCSVAGQENGETQQPEHRDDNLALRFSKNLYDAGKKNAVVIAHYHKSGPNTKNDYRQRGNLRVVYWNGIEIFTTREGGHIPQWRIDAEIKIQKNRM